MERGLVVYGSDSERLLQRIADLLGTDVGTFFALSDVAQSDDTNQNFGRSNDNFLIHRLVREFRGIPSKDFQLIALQILEIFSEVAQERDKSARADRKAKVIV